VGKGGIVMSRAEYRLLLEARDEWTVSEPASLDQTLKDFDRQIADDAFRPDGGRRLLVLSEHEWSARRSLARAEGKLIRTKCGPTEDHQV
jgi:hypothetical protein